MDLLPIETPQQRLIIYKEALSKIRIKSTYLCLLLPTLINESIFKENWLPSNTPNIFPELKKYLDHSFNSYGTAEYILGRHSYWFNENREYWRILVLEEIIKELEFN